MLYKLEGEPPIYLGNVYTMQGEHSSRSLNCFFFVQKGSGNLIAFQKTDFDDFAEMIEASKGGFPVGQKISLLYEPVKHPINNNIIVDRVEFTRPKKLYIAARRAGFASFEEFNKAFSKGFRSREDWINAKKGGFPNAQRFYHAKEMGFETDTEYSEGLKGGFTNVEDYQKAKELGYENYISY